MPSEEYSESDQGDNRVFRPSLSAKDFIGLDPRTREDYVAHLAQIGGNTERAPERTSFQNLLNAYHETGPIARGEVLRFDAEENGLSVYNIAPIEADGELILAGRVEPLEATAELDSEVRFFRRDQASPTERWVRIESMPARAVQDPAVTQIAGLTVLSGVEASWLPPNEKGEPQSSYLTRFWAGTSLDQLSAEPIASGPDQMKGIRLIDLGDGKVGVFTRPHGDRPAGEEHAGPGKIGFTIIQAANLEELKANLTPERIQAAPVIPNLCPDGAWMGPNQAFALRDGKIGVIGHIARWADAAKTQREYCTISFIFDPKDQSTQELRIISTSASFEGVEPKRPDLKLVEYPGGIIRRPDGQVDLYVGLGDRSAGRVTIPDPFHGQYAVN